MNIKKKENGFLATSFIYSFFLLFVAILAALLNDFIADKRILERYNDEAQVDLNTKLYTVVFNTSGADTATSTQRGQTLTNLIQNGGFSNTSWWNTFGTLNFKAEKFSKSAAKLENVSSNSYIYQNVQLLKNKQYYMS